MTRNTFEKLEATVSNTVMTNRVHVDSELNRHTHTHTHTQVSVRMHQHPRHLHRLWVHMFHSSIVESVDIIIPLFNYTSDNRVGLVGIPEVVT